MTSPHIHITIEQRPNGRIDVRTNDVPPTVGRAVSPAQSLSMDILRMCKARADVVEFDPQSPPLLAFARRFLDPEDLAHAVDPFVRDAARRAIGLPPVETGAHRE